MSYFDTLLETRKLDRCPLPLWRLKLTDEEYDNLKNTLKKKLLSWPPMNTNGMDREMRSFEREATLYLSEFHRREYNPNTADDNAPRTIAFKLLGFFSETEPKYQVRKSAFEKAYKNGAKRLGVEIYKGQKNEYVYSILYNGGLPLDKIFSNESEGTWHKLIKCLFESEERVEFNDEFDRLVNGIVANNIESLKLFCQQLQEAIITEDYTAMPFYCESAEDLRYTFFIEQGHKVEEEIKRQNPFRVNWKFEVNDIFKVIKPIYEVEGPRFIPFDSEFLDNYGLANMNTFSVEVFEDAHQINSVAYTKSNKEYTGDTAFDIHSKYNGYSSLSIRISGSESTLVSEDLDVHSPQLIREVEDMYVLSSNRHIGHKEVRIIVPEGWVVENEDQYDEIYRDYKYGDSKAMLIVLPRGVDNKPVVLSNEFGERKIFAPNIPINRMSVKNIGMEENIQQNVYYNVKNLTFEIKNANGHTRRVSNENLLFCSDRRTGHWSKEPSIGYVYVKSASENEYADPVRILNLGDKRSDFKIVYASSTNSLSKIKLIWNNGTVSNDSCICNNEGFWMIKKESCQDIRYSEFKFTPKGGSPFKLFVKTAFRDFSIYTPSGETLKDASIISLANIQSYTYHIFNVDAKMEISVGENTFYYEINATRSRNGLIHVNWSDKKNGQKDPYQILPDCSLDSLFRGYKDLEKLLYSSYADDKFARIMVKVSYDGLQFEFSIKRYPYKFEKEGYTHVWVKDYDGNVIDYNGTVYAIPLFKYEDVTPMIIEPNEEHCFVIPEEMAEWDHVLMYTGHNEDVLPHDAITSKEGENTPDENRANYEENFLPMLREEFPNAKIGDPSWMRCCYWFSKYCNDHIPSGSLWELKCACSSEALLLKFVLNLLLVGYSESVSFEDYRSKLREQLLRLAKEQAFLWFWVKPGNFMTVLNEEPDWDSLEKCVDAWRMDKALNGDIDARNACRNKVKILREEIETFLFSFVMEDFKSFMDELCEESFEDFIKGSSKEGMKYEELKLNSIRFDESYTVEDMIDALPLLSYQEDECVFEQYTVTGKAPNYTRFMERTNMFKSHLMGKDDIFKQKYSVRKSVIFYTRHYIDIFLDELIRKTN